jgi:CYTH domain-containing protein
VDRLFAPSVDRLERRLRRYRAVIRLDPSAPPRTGAMVTGRRIRRLGEVIAQTLGEVHSMANGQEAHRARIEAKRLRYVLEPLRGLPGVEVVVERLKALQDDLGDLHDSLVLDADLGRLAAEAPEEARPGLLILGERLRRRGAATFARLSPEWLHGAAAPFFGEVAELGSKLAAVPATVVEIERKYLLRGVPDAARAVAPMEMRQGYLPGTRLIERVREVRSFEGTAWYRTVKSGAGIARIELEEETTREVFEAMWPLTAARRVIKRRYRVPEGDLTWEIDEFTDRELVLAEIELPSADAEVRPPAWLAPQVVREVTDEPEYTNYRLAR